MKKLFCDVCDTLMDGAETALIEFQSNSISLLDIDLCKSCWNKFQTVVNKFALHKEMKKENKPEKKILLAIYDGEPHTRDNICHYRNPETGGCFDKPIDGYKIVYDEPKDDSPQEGEQSDN